MALSKKEYEKVLSAEAGVPVFLTDTEYEGIVTPRAAKPAAKASGGFSDPFEKVPELAAAERARKSSPDAWTTQKGVTYNNTHGRPSAAHSASLKDKAKAAHASAYGPGEAPWGSETAQPKAWGAAMPAPHPNATGKSSAVAAPANIGKIAPPSAPTDADYAAPMTYTPPPVYGKPTSAGKPFVVEQYDYDGYDFGLPLAGDPLKASAPADTVYAEKIEGNPKYDPWAVPIAINEAYAAKAAGTAAVNAAKKGY